MKQLLLQPRFLILGIPLGAGYALLGGRCGLDRFQRVWRVSLLRLFVQILL